MKIVYLHQMKGVCLEKAPSDAEEKEYLHYQLYLHDLNPDHDICIMCWLHPSKISIKSMKRVAGSLFEIPPHKVSLWFNFGKRPLLLDSSELFSGAQLIVWETGTFPMHIGRHGHIDSIEMLYKILLEHDKMFVEHDKLNQTERTSTQFSHMF